MTIREPEPKFTASDERLLKLMSSLLAEQESHKESSNLPPGDVGLSASESVELVKLFAEFLESKQFKIAETFVENVSNTEDEGEERAKEIYLSERKNRGRSRALSGMRWAELQNRLGIGHHANEVQAMNAEYFEKMERRLLFAAGISHEAIDAALSMLRTQREEIQRIRLRQRTLRHGLIREVLTTPLDKLRQAKGKLADRRMSGLQIVSAMTIIADVSVLFTTRDWTTTGTLSTMAGAMAGSVGGD